MQARVDDAKDSFFFGRPDLQLLQRFCFDRFGWGQAEVDKLLLPVLKVQPGHIMTHTHHPIAELLASDPSQLLDRHDLRRSWRPESRSTPYS